MRAQTDCWPIFQQFSNPMFEYVELELISFVYQQTNFVAMHDNLELFSDIHDVGLNMFDDFDCVAFELKSFVNKKNRPILNRKFPDSLLCDIDLIMLVGHCLVTFVMLV